MRIVKRIVVAVFVCVLVVYALDYALDRVLNPKDNYVVIINSSGRGLDPISLRLQKGEKVYWTFSEDFGLMDGKARAYLLPSAVFGGDLVLESGDMHHSCEIGPHRRHQNTIFMTVTDHDCTCVINKMPGQLPPADER